MSFECEVRSLIPFVLPLSYRSRPLPLTPQLFQHIDIPATDNSMIGNTHVLGLIKRVHIRNAVLKEDGLSVDPHKLRPINRLGGNTYARLGETFDIARPAWEELEAALKETKKE